MGSLRLAGAQRNHVGKPWCGETGLMNECGLLSGLIHWTPVAIFQSAVFNEHPEHLHGGADCHSWPFLGFWRSNTGIDGKLGLFVGLHVATALCQICLVPAPAAAILAGVSVCVCSNVPMLCEPYDEYWHPLWHFVSFSIWAHRGGFYSREE